jgi:hypothetical protein
MHLEERNDTHPELSPWKSLQFSTVLAAALALVFLTGCGGVDVHAYHYDNRFAREARHDCFGQRNARQVSPHEIWAFPQELE